MTALHLLVSTLIAYPLLSLIEYLIHRYLMHKRTVIWLSKGGYLAEVFRNHAITHHARCYMLLNSDSGKCATINITVQPLTSLLVIALPCVMMFAIDPTTSVVLLVGGLVSGCIWSVIHSEMHRPKGSWFSNVAVYLYLKRRHFLHHRYPNTNFNTLLPMWDPIFGTVSIETNGDRLTMRSAIWRVRPISSDRTNST
jgi:hypothetical protein